MEQDNQISVLYVDDEENNLIAFKASFRRDFKIYTALSALGGQRNLVQKSDPCINYGSTHAGY
jgi:response regulator RpfG family c-di-GMP phosphodiesterase